MNTTPIKKNTKREISAGLMVFRRTSVGLKFLILYHGGSYWNFPKGHIESEEKSLQAAIRETSEETGLHPRDLKLIKNFRVSDSYYFKQKGEGIFKIVIFYLAETRDKNVRISDEHSGFGWFLYKDALKIMGKYHGSQRILRKAFNFLTGSERSRPHPPAGQNARPKTR